MKKLVIMSGKSGCGKTFLVNNVIANSDKLEIVRKLSTRKLRPCENKILDLKTDCKIDEVMKCDIITKTAGQYYGINIQTIDNIIKNGKTPVIITSVIDVIKELTKIYSDYVSIYIKINLKEDELFKILQKQGREDKDILNKLISERKFITYEENSDIFNYLLVNNYDSKFEKEFIDILKKEKIL